MLALKKGKLSGQLSSDDWPLWRNTFLEMIEAGKATEDDVDEIRSRLSKCAGQRDMADVQARIKALEDERQHRKNAMGTVKAALLLMFGALITWFLDRHKGP
jgi:hypothetical protein